MNSQNKQLPFWLKLLYGSGDFGISSVGAMRSIFLVIYLTDVVGLDPQLASWGGLFGIIWDAVNDPLVGMLSDRVRSRLGRRRPFLLWFAIPFGLSFIILWSAPNWDNQIALLAYVTISFMIADTLQTLISVPYLSLTPELTPDYDERTKLASFRSFFQLAGTLIISVFAPNIVNGVVTAGGTYQQGYMIAGAIFGGIGAVPLILIGIFVKETTTVEQMESLPFMETLRVAWRNIPFRYAAGIFMLNWAAGDMIIAVFQHFLRYWVAGGDPLATVRIAGYDVAIVSAFFLILLSVSILFIRFWLWVARLRDKREAYMYGMAFWVVMQLLFFTIQPGQVGYLLVIAALTGVGVSAAYVLPDAMFADIIEWDELHTGRRQEGIYFGIRAFIRKLSGALVVFLALQMLGMFGYQTPPDDVTQFAQPESALMIIRLLVSIFGAIMLSGTIILTWLFPLTREKHKRMQALLERRRQKSSAGG
jgi:GPH family glycoside/pentoside/hexuronide:cation symporter